MQHFFSNNKHACEPLSWECKLIDHWHNMDLQVDCATCTMNLFFMKIPWKCLEKSINAFLMAMKTEISGFMAFIYTMKFPWNLEGWFPWALKSLQKYWKWFSWAIKFLSISDWQNSWPMKIQCQPNMNFMGHENSNWPWNSHESISGSFPQYPFIKRKKS